MNKKKLKIERSFNMILLYANYSIFHEWILYIFFMLMFIFFYYRFLCH
jgi:hypothetical protein